MAHVEKWKRSAIGHLTKHFERGKDERSEYIKFGNQDIDPIRTPDNYNLAPERVQVDFIHQRCGEVQCSTRKDVNVFCSWVVTAPKDLPAKDVQKFFKESYNFLANRYGGEKNIISAYVHMDETTPHMHFAFVPVVTDKKKGIEKVSAKELLTKYELKAFHGDLSNHMLHVFGRDIGILNEATKDGNKSIEELKRDSATQIMQDAREKAQDVQAQAEQTMREVSERVEVLRAEEKAIQGRLEGYKGAFKSIDEIEKLGKKTLTGNITMTADEANNLKQTAAAYWAMRTRAENVENLYNSEVGKLRQRVESTITLKIEKNQLQNQIKNLDAAIRDRDILIADINEALEKLSPDIKKVFMEAFNAIKEERKDIIKRNYSQHQGR